MWLVQVEMDLFCFVLFLEEVIEFIGEAQGELKHTRTCTHTCDTHT